MSDPFENYDTWLQKGNPAEDDFDPEYCPKCDSEMVYEDDVDVDEDGRASLCYGGWTCPNC